MEKVRRLLSRVAGSRVTEDMLEEVLAGNGDPARRLAEKVNRYRLNWRMTEKDMKEMEDDTYRQILPLRPVLCFLREQKRDMVQKVFEDIEAGIDRSAPPAGPEITRFFASRNEIDDAVFPEEIEEAKRRRLNKIRRLKRRLREEG